MDIDDIVNFGTSIVPSAKELSSYVTSPMRHPTLTPTSTSVTPPRMLSASFANCDGAIFKSPSSIVKGPPKSAESFPSLPISSSILEKLLLHQKEGVEWLFSQHKTGCGCLLADEMGLGKTVQVAAFLGSLLSHDIIRTVLLVVPPTLISVWSSALSEWGTVSPSVIDVVHAEKKAHREARWRRLSHGVQVVIITTYGIMKRDIALIAKQKPDYVVLDEAHVIKEANADVSRAALDIQGYHKIALTGTPLMNHFRDLWSLFEFLDPSLLGTTSAEFSKVNQTILRSNERDASKQERLFGEQQLEQLRARLNQRMLRREKKSLGLGVVQSRKTDVVVWVRLSQCQVQQYEEFLQSDVVRIALRELQTKQPLVLLNALRNIGNHAWLNFSEENFRQAMITPLHTPQNFPEFGNVLSSAKMNVALHLVKSFVHEGKKILVFSQSKRLLSVFMFILTLNGIKAIRMDGDVPPRQRPAIVKTFETSKELSVCLLTTQVGGVGLTLNCASRVIMLDPSWNPQMDAQAMDRVHRIGQVQDVVVIRLISCGTVDEMIYRNQIFKHMAAIQVNARQDEANEDASMCRYFTRMQLRSMFTLGNTHASDTATQLNRLHPDSVPHDDVFIRGYDGDEIGGVSDHSSLFSCHDTTASPENEDESADATVSSQKAKRRGRKCAKIQPPTATLTELAEQLGDFDIADLSQRSLSLAEADDSIPQCTGRCSILLQGTTLEDIFCDELRSTHFFFHGVPIRKLDIALVDETSRRSVCLDESFVDVCGFISSESDEETDDVLSPGGGAPIQGVDWSCFESEAADLCRPTHAERRRNASQWPSHYISEDDFR